MGVEHAWGSISGVHTPSSRPAAPPRSFFDVRAGEGRDVIVACSTLCCFMMAHGVLQTARDALFLSRLPAERLPWVYLIMAAAGLALAGLARRTKAPGGRRRLAGTLGLAAAVTAALALPAASGGATVAYVVYVWVGLAATGATVELWQLLGERFTIEQAKRLFGLVGAGGGLGVAAGAGLAALLGERLSSSGLLLLGAGCLAAAAVVPAFFTRDSRRAEVTSPLPDPPLPPYRLLREEPHARRLLYLAIAATLTLTLGDFLFKSSVAASIEPDRLAPFFGTFYACMNVAGLLIQLAATPWILRTLGAVRCLTLLPAALLVGAVVFAAAPVLAVAGAIKATDGALRHAVQATGLEVLYLPLPNSARRTLKQIVEVVGHRGAQAIASGGMLLVISLGADRRVTAAALALLAGAWIAGLVNVRRGYVDLISRRLRAGAVDVTAPLPDLDLAALEVLLVSLNSTDEGEVLAALTLLEQQGKIHLVPPLLAYHPSQRVALKALELLPRYGHRDVLPMLDHLLQGEDIERRAAALRAHHAIAPDLGTLEAHIDDRSPRVAAMVLVSLAAQEPWTPELAQRIREIAEGRDAAMKEALAGAIAEEAHPRFIATLVELGKNGDHAVRRLVAEAAGKLRTEHLVPTLIDMLAIRDIRDVAREALAAMGEGALPHLGRAWADPRTPLAVRRHIPRTLMHFAGAAAAGMLLDRIAIEPDGMTRYKALRALGGMRSIDSKLPLDRRRIRAHAEETLDRSVELLTFRVLLEQRQTTSPSAELLAGLLREKQHRAMERLFRLLGLLDPEQDYELLYDGLQRDDPKARAASSEILANTLEGDLRETLLVMIDEIDDDAKIGRLRGRHAATSSRGRLEHMTRDRSEAVRLLAEHHRAELALTEEEAPREPEPE
jgi:ATP:ADP antiporter, AAA family